VGIMGRVANCHLLFCDKAVICYESEAAPDLGEINKMTVYNGVVKLFKSFLCK
jgi:hypothetical protein